MNTVRDDVMANPSVCLSVTIVSSNSFRLLVWPWP